MLGGASRRTRIVSILRDESPLTGAVLAGRLGVTRQVMVKTSPFSELKGEDYRYAKRLRAA